MRFIEQCSWKRLTPDDPLDNTLNPFGCEEQDLTDFFYEDSAEYGRQLLAVTYTFELGDEVAAYYCVSNDIITREDTNTRGELKKLEKPIPHPKRMRSYPAVKVGRLAVKAKYAGSGFGSDILTLIKHHFTTGNKTGCRFITVDAYNKEKAIRYYRKNGFDFLTKQDEGEDTRLMFFDLIKFKPAV
jgi:GNAT superfamily N-acetyltransferase